MSQSTGTDHPFIVEEECERNLKAVDVKVRVKGAGFQRVQLPSGNWFVHQRPVAIEAAVEVTKPSELSMEGVARRLREQVT